MIRSPFFLSEISFGVQQSDFHGDYSDRRHSLMSVGCGQPLLSARGWRVAAFGGAESLDGRHTHGVNCVN